MTVQCNEPFGGIALKNKKIKLWVNTGKAICTLQTVSQYVIETYYMIYTYLMLTIYDTNMYQIPRDREY